jgi:hypothetical protein
MELTGENRRTRRETRTSATLSTTNLTWTDPGANPGLHIERPATNHLSHGTAYVFVLKMNIVIVRSLVYEIDSSLSTLFYNSLF